MRYELYRLEYTYKPRPIHFYNNGTHTHIEFFDFEHNEDYKDLIQEMGLDSNFILPPSPGIKKMCEWIYNDGDDFGLFLRYNHDGDLVLEEKTPLEGSWSKDYEDGSNVEIPFKDGLKHGEEFSYSKSGNKNLLTTWYKGFQDGPKIQWSADGRELSRQDWSKGELINLNGEKVKVIIHEDYVEPYEPPFEESKTFNFKMNNSFQLPDYLNNDKIINNGIIKIR